MCLSAELGATLLVGNYKATTKKRDRTNIVHYYNEEMIEKSIPMSAGDQKTQTVSKVESMTKILIIIIQHYWLNSYLFR